MRKHQATVNLVGFLRIILLASKYEAVNTKTEADTIKSFNWSFSVIYIFRVAQQFLLHVHLQILFQLK